MAHIPPHNLLTTLRLPLDYLQVVVREFVHPNASRSGLDPCLRRHGLARLAALQPSASPPPSKPFRAYQPGHVHISCKCLPQMANESPRRYLFLAIDDATRWVHVEITTDKSTRSAVAFLKAVRARAPSRLRELLTDNDKAFTDRLSHRAPQPSGEHIIDRVCAEAGIEHSLAPVRRPQIKGMVERFNGRISEALATHRFDSREDLAATIKRYAHLYNHHIPPRALGHRPPSRR